MNHNLKVKLYELEQNSKVAKAYQNHEKLFLNYTNLSEKLGNTSKYDQASDVNSQFAPDQNSYPRISNKENGFGLK